MISEIAFLILFVMLPTLCVAGACAAFVHCARQWWNDPG